MAFVFILKIYSRFRWVQCNYSNAKFQRFMCNRNAASTALFTSGSTDQKPWCSCWDEVRWTQKAPASAIHFGAAFSSVPQQCCSSLEVFPPWCILFCADLCRFHLRFRNWLKFHLLHVKYLHLETGFQFGVVGTDKLKDNNRSHDSLSSKQASGDGQGYTRWQCVCWPPWENCRGLPGFVSNSKNSPNVCINLSHAHMNISTHIHWASAKFKHSLEVVGKQRAMRSSESQKSQFSFFFSKELWMVVQTPLSRWLPPHNRNWSSQSAPAYAGHLCLYKVQGGRHGTGGRPGNNQH
jgi:hypothetical protein